MNKEIVDFKDLKVGKKYILTSTKANSWVPNGTEYMTIFRSVDVLECYKFAVVDCHYNIDIKPEDAPNWYIRAASSEAVVECAKEDKPAIEMLISGVDSLLDITDEPSILNLSLYGIISVGGTITIRKAKES